MVNELDSRSDAGQKTPVRKREKGSEQKSGEDLSTYEYDESKATDVSSSHPKTLEEETGANSDTNESFQSPSERQAFKRTMNDKRNQEKALRNPQKFDPSVTQAQVDRFAKVIHAAQYNVDRIGGCPVTEVDENENGGIFNREDVFSSAIKDHVSWLKKQVKVS